MNENHRIIQMLIKLREDNNLTQTEMANRIGIARNNYSRLESEQHQISLQKVADILDVFDLELDFKPKEK